MTDISPSMQQAELEAHLSKVVGQTLFGSYTVIGVIAKNAGSITYKAVESNGRKVALKVLVNPSAEVANVFVESTKALMALEHSNIATTRGCSKTSKEQSFAVREFVSGISLAEFLDSTGYIEQEDEIADILTQICDALEYAHCKGLVHGGIKPENIIFTEDGGDVTAKLTDFSRKVKRSQRDAKFDTIFEPTPLSDILQLGALTHALVSGQAAFPGRSFDEIASGQSLLGERNGTFATLRPDLYCTAELDQLVDEALDPDPSWRVQTISDFREGVKSWLEAVQLAKSEPEAPVKVLDKISDPEFIGQARANRVKPKKAKTTIKSMVRLRAHQRSQEQTVIFKIADTVASKGKGPRLSPGQTVLRLAAVALVTGVLASTAVVLFKNHPDEMRRAWLWTSQKLSAVLPASVRSQQPEGRRQIDSSLVQPGATQSAPASYVGTPRPIRTRTTAPEATVQHFNPELIHYFYRGEQPPGETNNIAKAGSNRFRIEYREFNKDWLK